MNNELDLYDVSWGVPSRHRRIRAEDAQTACDRVRDQHGWARMGAPLLDPRTKGRAYCEMLVRIPGGKYRLLCGIIV